MSAFHAQILASDTLFFDGDCEFMVVPCTDGAMGILSHHSNMIAAVVPGELRFQPVGGPLRTAAVSAGLVKVEAGEVMLLVSTAERPEDIDVNRARRAEDAAKEYAGAPERGGPAGPGHQPSADQRTLEQQTLSHENT